jgi:hypothetical protein
MIFCNMKSVSIFSTLLLVSCQFITSKVEDIADKAEQKVIDKTGKLADKVIPVLDSEVPDTKSNQLRFKEFLKVVLTADVKNSYCFNDDIGADTDYQFAFSCNSETAESIINKSKLVLDTKISDDGFSMQNDFPWWDKKKIEVLQLYT